MTKLSEIKQDIKGYLTQHFPAFYKFLQARFVEYKQVKDGEDYWNFWWSALLGPLKYLVEKIWHDVENDLGFTYEEWMSFFIYTLFNDVPDGEVIAKRFLEAWGA